MKRSCLLSLSLIFTLLAGKAEHPQRFFDRKDLMLSGTYYYPEQWPSDQWERDIKKIAALGFEFIHFGEFAWAFMEPREGMYDFVWLDEAIRLSQKYGLKIILCTPSAIPPVWLSEKHPDIMSVTDGGQSLQHGARQPASWASDTYRSYVEKIVAVLAKRYGNNPAVIGWQIDNEPSHYKYSYEYSENNRRKFIGWLRDKYGGIEVLNEAWGTAFWSETYGSFDQIVIPNPERLAGKANLHAMLDFKRYTADMAASFINFQADILRRHISEGQWITSNTMPAHAQVDPARMDHLDFPTYTRYLVHGLNIGHGGQGFRISKPEMIGWNNDLYRNFKGVTGVMEIQPGQVNWGVYNPQTYPGAVRLWYYHILAGGNKLVCHYRFRQPLKGSEQYHYGTMQTDGISVSRTGEEIVRFNRELSILRRNYNPEARMPPKLEKIRTAILVNPDNRWEMDFQPQTEQWNTVVHYDKYYNIVKSFAAPVDIIGENADFSKWPVLVVPAFQLLDKTLIDRWRKYVEEGGHLVLTCRTGQKNRNAHLWEAKLSEPIYKLIGARELFFDHLPPDIWASVKMDSDIFTWNNWADVLQPDRTSETWAVHNDQFYAGSAAVLHKKTGKGSVTYIGVDSDDSRLEKEVLRRIYKNRGEIYDLPEGIILEWRDGFWFGLNYTSEPYRFPIPANAQILIGIPETPAAGVIVWKESK